MPEWDYLVGDVREVLAEMPERLVHCCITSPPYWGLRDYGIPPSVWGGDPECEHEWGEERIKTYTGSQGQGGLGGPEYKASKAAESVREKNEGARCQHCGAWRGCLGLEPTPEMFIEHMVVVCRDIWRVLRDDGTFWLNLGDCYTSGSGGDRKIGEKDETRARARERTPGLKPKDLVMMPHRVVMRLQEEGWYVRSTIVWAKPNPMPESCTDRPTSSHEYIFLLTKKARYFYDADAVREIFDSKEHHPRTSGTIPGSERTDRHQGRAFFGNPMGRNLRNVWTIATQPFPEAHFATFPERIPELCIKAGTSEWGCCPECGAPWERVVEKEPNPSKYAADYDEDLVKASSPQKTSNPQSSASLHRNKGGVYYKGTTKGFQPTCECIEEWKRSCGADKNGEYHGKAIKDYEGTGAENPSEVKARILAGMVPKRTVGFQPTCDCPEHLEPIPCTVLDPFAGSGTTLKVARDLGRSAIGIDISAEYRKLAVKRAMLHTKDITSYTEAEA